MNAIELKQVKKRYGDFALNDVNICLPQGCVLGLIGENGAGKSTLIRMMCGMCKPDGGEVVVLGERAGRSAAFTRVKQDIGVVLDEACLPDGADRRRRLPSACAAYTHTGMTRHSAALCGGLRCRKIRRSGNIPAA